MRDLLCSLVLASLGLVGCGSARQHEDSPAAPPAPNAPAPNAPAPNAPPAANAPPAPNAPPTAAAKPFPKLADTPHWTYDAPEHRLVPREPLRFVGDRLEPPPPQVSAMDPALVRRAGNLSDRFVPTARSGAALERSGFAVLDELAELMLAGEWSVTVQVFLRSDPARCMGKLLAAKRAEAIRRYLVAHGVPAERVHAEAGRVTNPPPAVECPKGLDPFFQKILVLVEP